MKLRILQVRQQDGSLAFRAQKRTWWQWWWNDIEAEARRGNPEIRPVYFVPKFYSEYEEARKVIRKFSLEQKEKNTSPETVIWEGKL